MNASALFVPSRAKLNLVLRVVGRRTDGYHLLDTLFHALELHDDVAVHRRSGGGITIDVRADRDALLVPADERNLAVRAAAKLQAAAGDDGGFHIVLHKRIPNGGGLGGGSSNAAAVLRLGNHLLGAPLDHATLAALAVQLGADVPFFLRGGSQWGRGIGDELEVARHQPRWFVLVVPPFGCDTAAVYKNHAATWREPATPDTVRSLTVPKNRDAEVGMGFCNQLETAAEQLRPQLGAMRRAIVDAGYPHVRMSGSGSTLFVACGDAAAAERCREQLQSALATVDDKPVDFLVTRSGPEVDGDEPREAIPRTVRHHPVDPLG